MNIRLARRSMKQRNWYQPRTSSLCDAGPGWSEARYGSRAIQYNTRENGADAARRGTRAPGSRVVEGSMAFEIAASSSGGVLEIWDSELRSGQQRTGSLS